MSLGQLGGDVEAASRQDRWCQVARMVMYGPGIARLHVGALAARHQVAEDVARDIRRRCPVDNGDLLESVRGPVSRPAWERIFVGTDHWRFVEYGTPPHIIEPNRKKALFWPGAVHPVRRVMHPGTDAQPFMRRALYTKRSVRVVA